ncbi:hypothetical protein LWE61_08860 [Sphingobium sufflavum]|uniref:hypothetical protein n=1 Tax=Sphingobium sufflavum TaxID=1129547 RepID=UPI001F178D28|nr:hypothetical protein [Sphingobium sufflavum]MCE7796669.1 hypothetical protein [Sphingobium sufflavum]
MKFAYFLFGVAPLALLAPAQARIAAVFASAGQGRIVATQTLRADDPASFAVARDRDRPDHSRFLTVADPSVPDRTTPTPMRFIL